MNLNETRARLRAIFPGKSVSVTAQVGWCGIRKQDEEPEFIMFGHCGTTESLFYARGKNLSALIVEAEAHRDKLAAQRATASAPPQDASAAAECVTQESP